MKLTVFSSHNQLRGHGGSVKISEEAMLICQVALSPKFNAEVAGVMIRDLST